MSATNGIGGKEGDVQAIIAERDELKKRVAELEAFRLLDRELVEKASAIQFERDCFRSVMYVLSNKRFHQLDDPLMDFLHEHSTPADVMLEELKRIGS